MCPYPTPLPTELNAMPHRKGPNLANGRTARLGTAAAGGWPGLAGGGLRTGGVEGRRVGRRKDALAAVPRDQGRSVVGEVLGTATDVLRAVLDREQDGVGAQLPRQVSCLPRIYTCLFFFFSRPCFFMSFQSCSCSCSMYLQVGACFVFFLPSFPPRFMCFAVLTTRKILVLPLFSLPPTPSFMASVVSWKRPARGKNVTMSRTNMRVCSGD